MFTIDLDQYRLVDLSVVIKPPGTEERPLEVTLGSLADDTYRMDINRCHSHVGTHVEAPRHFYDDGKLITDIPLGAFLGGATVLSVTDSADQCVTGEVIDKHVGAIFETDHILLCRNSIPDSHGDESAWPMLTPDAARWMVEHHMKLLVVDQWFSLGEDVPATRQLHDILLSQDICIVEVTNLDDLTRPQCFFMALPIGFALDSSFARAIAIEER